MSVIGFDIGNRNSTVAVARARGIDVLVNEASRRQTPSMAAFDGTTRALGESALTGQARNLRNTICDFKRLLGREWEEQGVQEDIARQAYKVSKADDGSLQVQVNYEGETRFFSFEQITAMFVSHLQSSVVEKETQAKVGDAVFAVPGWWTDRQRRALRAALKVAGVNCLRVMSEGAAAALQYGLYKQDLPAEVPIHVLFIDFGQSQLSVSVGKFVKGKLEIVGAAHDPNLGGRNFDELLYDHFAAEFKTKYKIDVNENMKAKFRLLTSCEKLKMVLSAAPQAPLNIECLMNDIDVRSALTKEDFEKMIEPLLERAAATVKRALEETGVDANSLHAVELIGGSSRIPSFQERLTSILPIPLSHTLDKSEAVARGAALMAAILSPKFRVRDFSVTDATPHPIQISWGDKEGDTVTLFKRFNAVPATKVITFHRLDGFEITSSYAPDAALLPGCSQKIGTLKIPAITPTPDAEGTTLKVRIRLDLFGVFSFDSVTQVETLPAAPVVAEAAPPTTAATTPTPTPSPAETKEGENEAPKSPEAANSTDDKATDKEYDPASPTPDGTTPPTDTEKKPATPEPAKAAEAEPKKAKKRVKKTEVTVAKSLAGEASQRVVDSWFEKECQMLAADRLAMETADMRNKVESYVYDTRSRLTGDLAPFAEEPAKESFLALLSQTEDWLYDEGEDATKSVYTNKLAELQKIGDPIEHRFKEEQQREVAITALKGTIAQYEEEAKSTDEKFAHIPEEEREKVKVACAAATQWLSDVTAKQAALSRTQNPAFLVSDVSSQRDKLVSTCRPIMNKPKPKPKVETPPPAAAKADTAAPAGDAKPADTNNTPPPAADGEAKPTENGTESAEPKEADPGKIEEVSDDKPQEQAQAEPVAMDVE